MAGFIDGFDLKAYWMEALGAGAAVAVSGDGFSVYRRTRPMERMLDIMDSVDGSWAVLNGTLFDAYAAGLGGAPPTRDGLLGWTDAMTGAVLSTDNLYYLASGWLREPAAEDDVVTRALTEADAQAFAELDAACSPEDLDAGYVELDHAVVTGTFADGRLVCKASAYPLFEADEEDAPVWDIGFVTRPDARGKGYGKACAALLSREILGRGRVAQIRCTDDKLGSRGIALALGYRKYGVWSMPEGDE